MRKTLSADIKGDSSTSWKDAMFSSETDGNMSVLGSAFSSISISGMSNGGNRPPALSASSISSIGEEMNQKGLDLANYYNNHAGAPSSPLSTTSNSTRSQFYNHQESGFNSPTASHYHDVSNNSLQGESNKGFGVHAQRYPSFDSTLYEGRTQSSLPTFQEQHVEPQEVVSNGIHEKRIGSRHDDRAQSSFVDLKGFSRRSSIDSAELARHTSAFATWTASCNRSVNSLRNMGSVDENEQYCGNRARATSASAASGYNGAFSSSSFSNLTVSQGEFNYNDSFNSSPYANLDNSQHSRGLDGNVNMQGVRQRVMSADAPFSNMHMPDMPRRSSLIIPSKSFEERGRPRSFSMTSASSAPASSKHRGFPSGPGFIADYNRNIPQLRKMDGNFMVNQPEQPQEQYYSPNPHSNDPSGRVYLYEQQYRTKDIGYRNHDKFIRVQQPQGPPEKSWSPSYYQPFESSHAIKARPRTVYTVKFKRSQKNFFLNDQIKGDLKIGSYVKVEADRGEDLGVVLSRIPIEKFNPGARLNAPNMEIPDLHLKRITRLATDAEIAHLEIKEEEEAELLKICRSKTLQRGLPMNVVDAEYQFDRHKLTFFFEASCRVDFRELVRDLFSIYKTRIWMQQIDKVPGNPTPVSNGLPESAAPCYGHDAKRSNNGYSPLTNNRAHVSKTSAEPRSDGGGESSDSIPCFQDTNI